MARRKIEDRNIRKITKHSSSYSITIPIEIMRELGWKEKQNVTIKRVRGGVLIKDWRKK